MHIKKEHMYLGAALIQITEHPSFRFLSTFEQREGRAKCAFRINNRIGAYIKYCADTKPRARRFMFSFDRSDLDVFGSLQQGGHEAFIILVCGPQRVICVLSDWELCSLLENRKETMRRLEENYEVTVSAEPNKQFHVEACVKNAVKDIKFLGEIRVPRNAFPNVLFSN